MIHKVQHPLRARIDKRSALLSDDSVRNEEADSETEGVEYKTRAPSISPRPGTQAVLEGGASRRGKQKNERTSNRQRSPHGVNQVPKDHGFSRELRGRNQGT